MAKCKECKNYDYIFSCTINEQGEHHSYNDEPSIVYENGTKFWYKNGLCHRENDLPTVIRSDGSKFWHKNGKFHRTKGPAIIWSHGLIKEWWYEGKKCINVTKISETTFQFENQVGLILENIEDNVYFGILGDRKLHIYLNL